MSNPIITPNGAQSQNANGLTPEDVRILTERFPLEDHEVKPQLSGQKATQQGYQLWMPYVGEEAIFIRLSEVDPNFAFDIDRVDVRSNHVAIYASLTVKGVRRQGVGTGTGTDEMSEKGAATDALKRCARLFGIGVYLKRSPALFTDAQGKRHELEAQAMRKLGAWLNPPSQNGSSPHAQNTPPGESSPPPAREPEKPAPKNDSPDDAPGAVDCLADDGTLDFGAYQARMKKYKINMKDILDKLGGVGLNDVDPDQAIQVLEACINEKEGDPRPKA